MHAARTNRANPTRVCLVAMGLVVVALLVGAQPASGKHADAGRYTMTDLGTLGGGSSVAHAINSRGQIVGVSATDSWDTHAVLWSKQGR